MENLRKIDIENVTSIIQKVYLSDTIPWICGYSGGKDSTAIVQLVWNALSALPKEKLKKKVHIINTDTLVESPVVSLWAKGSLQKMEQVSIPSTEISSFTICFPVSGNIVPKLQQWQHPRFFFIIFYHGCHRLIF